MYALPCIHRSLMNIFPLLLLVLFSFITDVRINIHILYHNRLNPKELKLEVRWTLGDTTWEPLAYCKELEALDAYLELWGIAQPCNLPKHISHADHVKVTWPSVPKAKNFRIYHSGHPKKWLSTSQKPPPPPPSIREDGPFLEHPTHPNGHQLCHPNTSVGTTTSTERPKSGNSLQLIAMSYKWLAALSSRGMR